MRRGRQSESSLSTFFSYACLATGDGARSTSVTSDVQNILQEDEVGEMVGVKMGSGGSIKSIGTGVIIEVGIVIDSF